MYKYLLSAVFLSNTLYACDFCGCSPSVMSNDAMSLQPQSSVGTSVQYRNFRYLTSDANIERTQVVTQNFFVSYAPKKWVDLRLSLPINWIFNNYKTLDANTPTLNEKKFGVGDLMLFSNFRVFSKMAMGTKKVGHIVTLGYGMSFPTGSKKISSNELLQDFNFGTQTVGFYFSGTYSLSIRNKWSLVNSALVKLNVLNKDNVKYGNMYSYKLSANYTATFKKIFLIPILGMRADISQKNIHNNIIQPKSGGWTLAADMGFQFIIKDFAFNVNVSQPVAQKISAGSIIQKTAVSCMLKYQIKQRVKVINENPSAKKLKN